ncbi:MAG: tetratricopeptide repeat protein [Sphingomonas sp.]|uniref:tetratricopeptide repeat protein n=1 Tax=Sphingomonas sp. TaxID=28214 RepID=UPI001B117387|nr:tetratricopeptide repeat protein [Sphingomonas sp.]MBO9622985.1 tetratricopeptide repeat protein [Sphingomonas sp.]
MTFVSKLALAAVLTLGAPVLVAAPAAAQNKGEKAPEIKVSPEFRTPAAAAEAAFKAQDLATADTQLTAAEAVAKNDDERYFAASLRLQIELARKNTPGQMKALQVLSTSPKVPADKVRLYGAVYNYMLGDQLLTAKKPAEALPALLKARELGSDQPDLPVLLANAYAGTGKQAEAVAEVDRAIQASKGAGRKPPQEWYKFAIPRVNQLGDRAATATWLSRYIQEYPSVQNWRWAVSVFGLGASDDKAEKLSLFRLMRSTHALAGRSDYAAYAYTAQQAGLPWEAVAVIDEGRKSGVIPAGDSDTQQIYTASQNAARAEGSLDGLAKQAAGAANGKNAVSTGDAYLASGNNARAVELYDLALQKGGVNADQVNLNRGVALQRLGRKDEARAAFQQVKTGPYANLALLWAASVDFPPLA